MSRTSGRAFGPAIVLAFSLVACLGRDAASPATVQVAEPTKQARPPAPVETAPVHSGDRQAPSAGLVHLLDPGATPRTALRYRVAPGAKESVDAVIRVEMDLDDRSGLGLGGLVGQQVPMRVSLVAALEMESPPPPAGIGVRFELTKLDAAQGARPSGPPRPGSWIKGLPSGGSKGRVELTTSGVLRATSESDRVEHSVREMVRVAVVPFPDEPLGLGARWETSAADEQEGEVVTRERREYTLVALSGAKGRVQVSWSGDAAPREGNELSLEMRSSGTMTMEFDLSRVVSRTHAEMSVSSSMALGSNVPAGTPLGPPGAALFHMVFRHTVDISPSP